MAPVAYSTSSRWSLAWLSPDGHKLLLTRALRTIASAFSPVLSGFAFGFAALGVPFFVAGGLKIAYDGLFYATFRKVRPSEEELRVQSRLTRQAVRP